MPTLSRVLNGTAINFVTATTVASSIVTHGNVNPKYHLILPVTRNGDRLPVTDIAALKLLINTCFVVLSACETELSSAGPDGTESSGMGGYVFRRGAKSVFASL